VNPLAYFLDMAPMTGHSPCEQFRLGVVPEPVPRRRRCPHKPARALHRSRVGRKDAIRAPPSTRTGTSRTTRRRSRGHQSLIHYAMAGCRKDACPRIAGERSRSLRRCSRARSPLRRSSATACGVERLRAPEAAHCGGGAPIP
jgi:hypothetical protein